MPIRDRILKRRARFIAAAITLSCGGGKVPDPGDASSSSSGDAAIVDASKKDGAGGDAQDMDAGEDVSQADVADTGPQPCLAPM